MRIWTAAAAAALMAACAPQVNDDRADVFLDNLRVHCGAAYEGRLVSNDETDARFAAARLVMHVRQCDEEAIRIPLHVDEDRSRTWVITRTQAGLRLKHDHRHEDGAEDVITQYGGDSAAGDSPQRIEFPVDQYSIDLFNREGLTASTQNVWALELTDTIFADELSRENRFFRAEFDLTTPVESPPPPWGAN